MIGNFLIFHNSLAFETRLVFFPMSGYNTFKTLDFADLRFSFWSSEGVPVSTTVFLWKNYFETWNKWFCVLLPKSLSFFVFWLEKNQRANSWEKKLTKLFFESNVFMKLVSINSNTICLSLSEILWKVLEK